MIKGPKGKQGMSGPTSLMEFELKDGNWTEKYVELENLCLAIVNFINHNPELSTKVEITEEYIRSFI